MKKTLYELVTDQLHAEVSGNMYYDEARERDQRLEFLEAKLDELTNTELLRRISEELEEMLKP